MTKGVIGTLQLLMSNNMAITTLRWCPYRASSCFWCWFGRCSRYVGSNSGSRRKRPLNFVAFGVHSHGISVAVSPR